ncbi:MAG: hypothetical protein IPJ48_00175 [Propionivibrio sp.]|uniref:Uncharacterized protein n=1 Tax=Candidatus Propionivibrio dominans TaxID=2954373 RepID=A0A9D7I6Y8_9RHOO|nr:hypothetical protein [Candidatus Propionivibrio dominans]
MTYATVAVASAASSCMVCASKEGMVLKSKEKTRETRLETSLKKITSPLLIFVDHEHVC